MREKIETPCADVATVARTGHEGTEVGLPVIVTRHELGVDDGARRGQHRDAVAHEAEAVGQVLAVPTVDGDDIAILVQLRAPAVEFHFVQPAVATRRRRLEDRRRWDDEGKFFEHIGQLGSGDVEGKSLDSLHEQIILWRTERPPCRPRCSQVR